MEVKENMFRFAHIADCHLGAWRDARLRELNLEAFVRALDLSVQEKVNFIIVSGDLFHVNIPDLNLVKTVVEKFREIREKGIEIYMVYGSHDYSPNVVSIVDILSSAGLFKKVVQAENSEDLIKLQFFRDEYTGAKIVGLSGRSGSLEKGYFEALDRDSLRVEDGFKIFVFHSAVNELKPISTASMESVPLSYLPPGFNYYAGGHIHKRVWEDVKGYGVIAYPGPLFGATFTDLEDTAGGERRGFYIIDFDGELVKTSRFIEIMVSEVIYEELDGEGKTAKQVEKNLLDLTTKINSSGNIVLIRVRGTLSSGRVGDIDFTQVRDLLMEKGATYVFINRVALTTEAATSVTLPGESVEEIESRLLNEVVASFKVDSTLPPRVQKVLKERLTEQGGTALARQLLLVLKTEPLQDEKKREFENRVLQETLKVLKLEELE
jgi:DNA repair exonuclease SbcCD nuclease subunit